MPDDITYQAPVGARVLPGSLNLRPRRIVLDLDEESGLVEITYHGDNGVRITTRRTGQVALDLIEQLNTMNLSIKNLKRRIIELDLADAKIPAGGTVS